MPLSPEDRFVELTDQPIDADRLTQFVTTPLSGAVILFLGTVRELTHGKRTISLDYDAYPEMALKKMNELVDETAEKWPVQKVAIVHRTGKLELAEASVAIALSCPHRGDVFDAGRFLIDELKIRVPIWKKENWSDGTTEWVHPGADAPSTNPRTEAE